MAALDNANPTILSASQLPTRHCKPSPRRGPDTIYSHVIWGRNVQDDSTYAPEPIDEQEIYDLVSPISDPEHPVSLGQLSVVNLDDIHLDPPPAKHSLNSNAIVQVVVDITPTITHCSLATVIGLGVRARLEQCLPPNYRVDVRCKANSHTQDEQVNKQLADKERVAAALENDSLRAVLDKMLETCV
ncbi:hypothetical protein CDD82_2518 [Ophiocordyceps australis]|uniref:Uncharacterized protein n=1 Tax=Ophiocordyceps australis TaxID=1399860 RepID=A0A2C5XUA1_9HYPO|nr:hypothetical protein CDD82_2518 [Ophiocordyceps australis]